MILHPEAINELRMALEQSHRPLFYYDDDADGLSSFLLLYRFVREGKGVIVKTTSTLTKDWARKAEEYGPDAVFVLDVPVVEQEFVDAVRVPVYWVDHHQPVELRGVHYYNPRQQDVHAYIPTTRMAYEVVQQDMWIAAVGCVADWYPLDFVDALVAAYPGLFDTRFREPDSALFESKVGKLARMFSFVLKGQTSDALQSVKVLTRISSPYEILSGSTPAGKFILKRFEHINKNYEELLELALAQRTRGKFFVFKYDERLWSFTSELSNELAHRYPKKVIFVCREKGGEYKCSLRTRGKPILPVLQKALEGLRGHGGGHENACGVVIATEDFDVFMKRLKKEYKL